MRSLVMPCFATNDLHLDVFASRVLLRRALQCNCARENAGSASTRNYAGGWTMNALRSRIRAAALGLTLAGCAAALPAYAGDPTDDRGQGSRQSDVGAVTGLAVGAMVAGPLGAVIGAGAGALLGDRYHRQAQASAALASNLDKSQAESARLVHELTQLDGSLAQTRARGEQLNEALQHTDQVGLDVSFRTNDDSIAVQNLAPLLKLGALIVAVPQARVRIAG